MDDGNEKRPVHYEENRSKGTNYIYHQYDHNLNFGKHLHASFEILYLKSGEMETEIDQTVFHLHAGDSILIFPNQIHAYRSEQSESELLIFSSDLVPHYAKAIAGKRYANPLFHLEETPRLLEAIQQGKNPYLNKGYAYQLLGAMDELGELVDAANLSDSLLKTLTDYVKDNYDQDISLRQLASKSGYSYNYVSSLFNRSLGINFAKYVNLYRIEQSVYDLSSTEKSITDIAFGCGFKNVRSFNREFLALKGMSPSEFRRVNKKTR